MVHEAAVDVDAVGRRRGRPARTAAIAVGAVVALLIVVLATRKPAQSELPDNPVVGRVAPSISGTSLDGAVVSLASMRGRYVLVNFFNDWCVPCQLEHPELLKFAERHKAAADASVLGVIHGGDAGDVRAYLAKEGGDWPVLDDPRGQVALDYGVRGQPETYVVDPQGRIISRIASQVTADGLDRLLARAKQLEAEAAR